MDTTRKTARVAGWLYLMMGIPAWFSLMYVPGRLIAAGDAAATAANILASERLFRLGVVSDLISAIFLMFLALTLHRLFKDVSEGQAALLLILVLIQVPLVFQNEVSSLAALALVRGAGFLSVFDTHQLDALAMLFLKLHNQGLIVSQIFWGLWLFPFGLLVYRSRFIPRILGVFLGVNGCAYVVTSLTGLLAPRLYPAVFRAAFPALLGEAAIMLWLLIVGARPRRSDAGAQPAASTAG